MEALLKNLFTSAEDAAEKSREKSDRSKQSDKAMWQGVLHGGPEIDDDHRLKAATELAKIHGLKKGENPYEKVATILNTLGSHIRNKAPNGQAAPASTPQAEAAPGASVPPPSGQQGIGLHPLSPEPPATSGGIVSAAGQVPPPDPQKDKVDADTNKIQEKTNAVTGGFLRKVGKGLNTGLHRIDAGIKEYQTTHGERAKDSMIDSYTGSDGKRHEVMQRADGTTFERTSDVGASGFGAGKKIDSYVGADGKKHDIFQRSDGSTYEAASEGSVKETGSARPVYGPPMSIRNARELAQKGMEFMGEDGKQIDVASLPDEMGLKRFTVQGKTVWVPFSPNEKVVTVGNESYAISPMDVDALTKGAGTDLGQKNVGSTNLPGYTGIDAQGTVQRVAGQRTPGTTGVKRDQGLTPLDTPTNANGRGAKGAAKTKPSGSSKKDLPLPISSYGKQADRATGVHLAQAALQQFRDDNLAVYDNPESVEKLKNIIGYIQKTAEQQIGTGQGPLGAVETWAGLPTAMNRLQQQLLQDQSIQLNQDEQRFLADYFYLLGSWPGMRKSVGTSPAKWSMNLMFSELPTPGLVNSSAEAKHRLANMEKETKQVVLPKQLQGLDGDDSPTKDSGTKDYKIPGKSKVYRIPADMVKEFLKDNPKAQAVQ